MNRHLVLPALLAVALAGYPSIIHSADKGAESSVFTEDIYRAELKLERNMSSFNRAIGILGDLLREQRRLFSEKKGGANNETADKAEEEMNEANLFAAQKQYDEGYAALERAFDLLSTSIKELLATAGK